MDLRFEPHTTLRFGGYSCDLGSAVSNRKRFAICDLEYLAHGCRALLEGMDWWYMGWSFSESAKYLLRGQNLQEIRRNSAERERERVPQVSGSDSEITESENMQCHTPKHFISPLNSLLMSGFQTVVGEAEVKFRVV